MLEFSYHSNIIVFFDIEIDITKVIKLYVPWCGDGLRSVAGV